MKFLNIILLILYLFSKYLRHTLQEHPSCRHTAQAHPVCRHPPACRQSDFFFQNVHVTLNLEGGGRVTEIGSPPFNR